MTLIILLFAAIISLALSLYQPPEDAKEIGGEEKTWKKVYFIKKENVYLFIYLMPVYKINNFTRADLL